MAADAGNSEPSCPLWWLMDARCYIITLFDSMSHFVQDEFQSTNSEGNFKHIQYMSRNTHKTYPKHILKTHRKHSRNIKSKQNHIFKVYIIFNFYQSYRTKRQRKFQKEETYRRGWLLWITNGRANPLMDRKVVGVFVFFEVAAMVAMATSPTTAGCSVV